MDKKEIISNKQAISLIVLFLIGEGAIYIQASVSKKDIWLAYMLAIVFALPMVIMYARIQSLFPDKDLFDIIETCIGKYMGKLLAIIIIWYSFHAIAQVLEDLGFFINNTLFPETPYIVIIITFSAACAYVAKQGIEVLGRWAEIFLIVPIILIILILLLLIPKIDFTNILPVLYEGIQPVLKGSFLTFGFPLAYIVQYLLIFSFSKKKNSPYKIYILGFLIGAALLFIIYLLDMLVLGEYLVSIYKFPTYIAVSRIKIGEFFQRLDIIAAAIFLIGIYVQTNVFLLGTCKGIAKLFKFPDYRFIVIPVTLLVINLCYYEPGTVIYYFKWSSEIWPYYIIPFEVIFPLIIWITAEIKAKRIKNAGINTPD